MCVIHGANADCDAEPLQRRLVEQHEALGVRIGGQELDRERLAGLRIHELLIADLIASLFQKPRRLAQIRTHIFGVAPDRILEGLGEHFRRDLVAHGFKNFELFALRETRAGKLGAFEIAVDALVLPEEQLLVHLLEIERIVEGAA